MTTTVRKFLVLGTLLVLMTSAGAYAQDAAATAVLPVPTLIEPASGQTTTETGTGSELPFTRDGANQPVLQTISPDGVAIAPEAMESTMAEEGAHGEGHSKGLPQFDPSTFSKQIFWLVLTFAGLYFVYARKTLPAISGALDNRAARINADLQAAEALKIEVDAIRTQYEAAIASAQADAQKLITSVQADIKTMVEAQDTSFKARAEEASTALEKRLDVSRTRIMAELTTLAADLTVDITAQVAGIKVDNKTAQGAIDALSGKAKAA